MLLCVPTFPIKSLRGGGGTCYHGLKSYHGNVPPCFPSSLWSWRGGDVNLPRLKILSWECAPLAVSYQISDEGHVRPNYHALKSYHGNVFLFPIRSLRGGGHQGRTQLGFSEGGGGGEIRQRS